MKPAETPEKVSYSCIDLDDMSLIGDEEFETNFSIEG